MLKKNFGIIIAVVILAVAAFVLVSKNTKSSIQVELKDFSLKDTTNISKIFLTDKANHRVTLVKEHPGSWILNDSLKGHNEIVKIFLYTMLRMQVREPVSNAAHNGIIKQLASSATKVEVYETKPRFTLFGWELFPHESNIKTFYVGENTQDNQGTFMLLENSSAPFIVHIPGFRGFLSTRFSALEKDWRDPSMINLTANEIKSVTIRYPADETLSFKIEEAGEKKFDLFELTANKRIAKYDTFALLNFMASFRALSYEKLLNQFAQKSKDSLLASKPYYQIEVIDKKNKAYRFKTYKRAANEEAVDEKGNPLQFDPDKLYAFINNDQEVALITYYGFDRIMLPITTFLPHEIETKILKK